MGQVYYDMGFLATTEVIECSATELIGQYVGQTGPKTQRLLEKALGKVLFIDEAYRLADGHFAKEAMDELVDCLTKPKFARKLIVILAGYDTDMNRLMSVNPGLTSRFPDTVVFRDLSPADCLTLFREKLVRSTKNKDNLDVTVLDDSTASTAAVLFCAVLRTKFAELAKLANWANARDVETLARNVFGRIVRSTSPKQSQKLMVAEALVLEEINAMAQERAHRSDQNSQLPAAGKPLQLPDDLFARNNPPPPPPAHVSASRAAQHETRNY
jgi:hypothetical protein